MGTTVLVGLGAAMDGTIGARNRVMQVAMVNFMFVNGAGLCWCMIGIFSRVEVGDGE